MVGNSGRMVSISDALPGYKFPRTRVEEIIKKGKEAEAGIGSTEKNFASEVSQYAHQAKKIGNNIQAQKDTIEGL
ncbi:hypothetical protein WAI453_009784 [Rhynchosporium graminicola]